MISSLIGIDGPAQSITTFPTAGRQQRGETAAVTEVPRLPGAASRKSGDFRYGNASALIPLTRRCDMPINPPLNRELRMGLIGGGGGFIGRVHAWAAQREGRAVLVA